MKKPHNHYDSLMVSRNASPEVIKAAFRSLSQKYHPDKSSHPDAVRIMQQLAESYEILSDPLKREDFDRLLDDYEYGTISENAFSSPRAKDNTASSKKQTVIVIIPDIASLDNIKQSIVEFFTLIVEFFTSIVDALSITPSKKHYITFVLLLSALIVILITNPSSDNASYGDMDTLTTDVQTEDTNEEQEYDKNYKEDIAVPEIDSADHYYTSASVSLPSKTGYVPGYPKLNHDGASIITVDNSRNSEAIFGKLYDLDTPKPRAVRYFYIEARGGLNLRHISPGRYDLRYEDLESGYILKSHPILVEEYENQYETGFSMINIPIYKIYDSNTPTEAIYKDEF